jgi:hypothetical protein
MISKMINDSLLLGLELHNSPIELLKKLEQVFRLDETNCKVEGTEIQPISIRKQKAQEALIYKDRFDNDLRKIHGKVESAIGIQHKFLENVLNFAKLIGETTDAPMWQEKGYELQELWERSERFKTSVIYVLDKWSKIYL